jgi:hypothetical protein
MIWQHHEQHGSRQSEIASHILETIPALCGNAALAANPRLVAVAEGVAAYLAESPDGRPIPDVNGTVELMCRALDANGETGLARRIVVCGSTLVHPATWLTANGQTIWIMDLALLRDRDSGCLEMALFERIRVTLDTFADVWDQTGGHGVLGLKHLPGAAKAILGTGAVESAVRRFCSELQTYCGDRLRHLSRVRQWQSTPVIVGLHA